MTDNKVAQKRIWAFHAGPMVGYFVGQSPGAGSNVAEYHRADLSADLVRAALYETRGLTWSGVEALAVDPAAVAAIVAQVMEKENE